MEWDKARVLMAEQSIFPPMEMTPTLGFEFNGHRCRSVPLRERRLPRVISLRVTGSESRR